MERRTILGILVQTGSAMVAGVVGIPALVAGISPMFTRRRTEAWRPLGPIESFPLGAVQQGIVEMARAEVWPQPMRHKAVYVWRVSADETIVYSRSCTDLGCPVDWDAGSECFFCPCHGGVFSKQGERMAGPPRRALWRYANRVRGGVLEIDLSSVPPIA